MTRSPVGRLLAHDGQALSRTQATAAAQRMLWTPRDVSRCGSVVALSGVVLAGAWFSVAGKANWDDQVIGMNVGIVALVASNAAGVLFLLSGRRAVGVRRMALLGDPAPVAVVPAQTQPAHDLLHAPVDALVAGEGLAHFHRADCPLAVHKSFIAATRSEHERSGHAACGVCRP
jgi:uncharacterized membrane protein (UPF0136 family)